jgi:2-(1,2-epoxy-1,2-dihydrophenyl)acetyl-CoA isomerase
MAEDGGQQQSRERTWVGVEPVDGVEVALRDGALVVTIDRPARRNALTPDQVHHIGQVCAAAERDDAVRVVEIRGTGDSFCAGADLSDADLSASGGQIPPISMGRNLFLPILELSKPLVGVINGVAAGGGLGLALCCDIRIASERARFATAFTRIGITANDAVAYLLPRIVGIAKALELIYFGRPIDAAEAERIGLVSYVRPHDDLAAFADDFVERLLAGPPAALRFSKRLVLDGLDRTYREHVLAQEYASLANRVLADHDIQEGVAAFKEKREPRFQGIRATPRWQNY